MSDLVGDVHGVEVAPPKDIFAKGILGSVGALEGLGLIGLQYPADAGLRHWSYGSKNTNLVLSWVLYEFLFY